MRTRENLAPPRAEAGFMIKVLMALFVASIGLLGALVTPGMPVANAQTGDDATAFGEEVVSFAPGRYGGTTACPPNNQGGSASGLLGAPNAPMGDAGYPISTAAVASLGYGGSVTVRFTSPAGGDGDVSTPDVWVWETGPAAEHYLVEVSEDGTAWTVVGESDQQTHGSQGFDVDHAGFDEFSQINYIRVTDLSTFEPDTSTCGIDTTVDGFTAAGSDIDAVGVISRPVYADLEIVKSHDVADGTVLAVDDVIEYTFEVTNTGTVDLTGVTVSDPLPGLRDMTPATADIPAGESATFTALYDVTQDDIDAGEIANQATATGDPPAACTTCETPEVPSNEVIVELPQDPALELVKSSNILDGETVDVDDVIEYTFEVTNTGTVTITDVVITDPMAGLTWVTGPELGDLAPGESATGTAAYVVTEADVIAGVVENSATATGNPPEGCEGDCDPTSPPGEETVTTDPPVADLALVKSASPGGPVAAGDTITYTFEVANTGTVTITDVVIEDPLPGLTWVTGPNLGDLAPGDTAVGTATYLVTDDDVLSGSVANSATTTGNPPDGCTDCDPTSPPSEQEVPTEGGPSIVLDKEADVDVGAALVEGDTVTYTFFVRNTSEIPLTDVTVTDPLPGLSEISPASVDELAPDAVAVFTATYVVTDADVERGVIVNTATATGLCGDDCTPPTATDSEMVPPVAANPGLVLDKVPGTTGPVAEGDEITYTFTVTNTGNVDLTGVTIDDPMEGLGPITPASIDVLERGQSTTFTATYTVGADDIVAGQIVNAATATGSCGDGCTVTTPPDEEIVTTEDPEPGLSIDKESNVEDGETVGEGDTVTYTFTVVNTGNITLTDVTVDDDLEGLSAITPASVASLAPGASTTFTATYVVTAADVLAGQIVNTATSTGNPPDGCPDCDPTSPPDEEIVVTEDPEPGLSIDKESNVADDALVREGDTITYTFTVVNTGNITLTDVSVADDLEGLSGIDPVSVASLAPGATAEFTATYTVDADDIAAGEIVNAATATGSCGDECSTTSTPDEEIVTTANPAMTIDKESDVADDETVAEGDTITYTFLVTNTGNVDLTGVTIDDNLGGLSDISPASADIPVGGSATFTATYTVDADDVVAGEIVNAATATGSCGDECTVTTPPDEEIVTTEDPAPALSIDKESNVENGETVGEGDEIVYTFVVTNTGNITLTDVTVEDDLEGLSDLDPASVASLAPGESATFTATYVVTDVDVLAGQVVNTATSTGNPPDGCTDCDPTSPPDEEIVVTEDPEPGLSLVKDSDVAEGETVGEGETVTYTFVVTNTGNVDLTGVSVNDVLEGLSEISPTSADIPVGESATFTATYTVDADDIAAGQIENVATATGSCGDGCTVTSPPDEEITVTDDPVPGLSLIKDSNVADGETVGEGDTITYTFTVTNTGDVDLTGVTIDDPLPGLSAIDPASADIAVGESATFTATYVVSATDVQEGSIVNSATATGSCGDECSTESPPDEEIVTTEDTDPALAIDKESNVADGATVEEGDTVTYTFVVTNTGNVTLTNVSVTDSLEGLSAITPASVASLAPGAGATFTATYVVTGEDAANGSIVNTATSTGSCGPQCTTTSPPDEETVTVTTPPTEVPPTEVPPTEVPPTEVPPTEVPTEVPPTEEPTEVPTEEPTVVPPTEEPTQVPAPALTLDKQASTAGPVPAGFALTYYFVVQNVGNVAIPDVTISDPLPGLTWVVGPNLGTLQPGESAIGSATYIVTEADAATGAIVNRATVDCAQGGCVPNVPVDEETIESCTVQGMENETSAAQPGIRTFRQVTTEEPVIPTEEPVIPTEEPVVTEEPVIPTEEPVIPTEEPVVTEAPAATEEPAATEAAEDAAAAGGVIEDPCAPPPTVAPPTEPPSQPGGGHDGGSNGGGTSGGGSSDGGPVISVLPSTGHTDAGTGQLASTATFLALAIVAFTMLGAAALVRRTRRD